MVAIKILDKCWFLSDVSLKSNRVSCNHAGWFHCKFTNLGLNMKGAGEVLYSTVLQESSSPIPANCYTAGPLYDIRCVQGELCQLKLPHCETSIDDGIHSMSVIHYSGDLVELLKPQNITSTHVTVSIPGTSEFRLVNIINWFKEKISGQVMLFYLQPTHKLHVFLQPYKLNPKKVAACNMNYELIQTICDCTLKYNSIYSMSCVPVEEHGASVTPVIKIQPQTQKFCCPFKERSHYFPSFEIFLPDDVMNVRLSLKKKKPNPEKVKVVWDCEIHLKEHVTNKSFSSSTDEQCVSFLKKNRCEIIQRIVNIDAIMGGFADVIPPELLNRIRAATICQEKTRAIYYYLDIMPALKQLFFQIVEAK